MSTLRIKDAPLLPDVDGSEKIPTGGRGDYAVTLDQVKTFARGGLPQQIEDHINNTSNPHQVTKDQVGLGNADNTSDVDKPISTATQEALDLKANTVNVDEALNLKADKTYVDIQDSLKANKETTYTKLEVDESLSIKADKSYVDSQDLLKADKSYVDEQNILKADKETTYTKTEVDSQLNLKSDKTYVDSQDSLKADKTYVDEALSSLSTQASKFYPTLAEANADIANIEVNQPVQVGEVANGGLWYKDAAEATSLTKSGYDPLQKAKSYTDSNIIEVKNNTKQIFQAPDQDVVAVLTDAKNKVLLGYDTQKDKPVVAGLEKEIEEIAFENIKNLRMSNDRAKIAVLVDKNNKILIGYDTEKDEPILAGSNTSQIEIEKKYEAAFEQKLLTSAVNHFLFYGQSLSIGATATTILSTSQPYSNITFNTGPRMDSTATTTIPLVEQFNNPASDGGGNRGETCCSAAANYVSRSIEIDDGIDPASHVIFASTAGQGGTIINNLKKGSSRYNFMLSQVTKAKQLVGSDYKVQLVTWIQGESDIDQGTTYANYKAMLQQLQIDINNDIKSITGQADDIKLITYQCSYKAKTSKDIALAQLHLAQENANFYFACPTYRMPYYTDKTHLTNVGYKLMGAYFGRAYKQLVIDNAKPDFLNPKSAFASGRKITISFDVPRLPLKIDTTALAPTQDYGFKVLDSAQNLVIIESINIDQNKVILNCSAEITSNVTVRYALDYLATGLNILSGASGNLRDSSDEFVEILNQKYQLFNACPAFEITAFVDKGI